MRAQLKKIWSILPFVLFAVPAFAADYSQSIAENGTFQIYFHHCGSTGDGYAANLANNTIAPAHGTFSDGGFGTLPLTQEFNDCGTTTGTVNAEIILYTADSGYNGPDVFQFYNSETLINDNYFLAIGSATGNLPSSVVSAGKNMMSSVNFLTKFISLRTASLFRRTGPGGGQGGQASLATKASPTPPENRLDFAIRPNHLGLSAGDQFDRHGAWANPGYTFTKDKNLVTVAESDLYTLVAGYDYLLGDSLAAGAALTYEYMDEDSQYNLGSVQTNGYSLAPYLTWLVTDYLSCDLIAGYTFVSYDQDRASGAISSSLNAQRYFVQATVNGFYYLDSWTFVANMAYLYAHEKQEGFTESNLAVVPENSIDVAQWTAGLEVAYSLDTMEPYLLLNFAYDSKYDAILGLDYDRTGGEAGLGVRLNLRDRLVMDVHGTSSFARQNLDEYAFQGNLRYSF